MSRFIGTETEYGIATPSNTAMSPIVTSTHAVVAYGATQPCATGARWDFASEHPLRDQRGFDLRRYHTVPVIDPNAIGVANVVTTAGARFYVDHAHPEYSSPETTNALDATLYDAAGDLILLRAATAVADFTAQDHSVLDHHDPCPELKIYKNNVDGKGASYGSHENYFYSRDIDFDVLAQALIPFFVTRQVLIGAGRVGIGERGEKPGFQISQRADYIEQEISLETTLNRGIINTRDEPHTDADTGARLHVIIGDANMSQQSNLLKLGMTTLVIDAVEQGVDFSDLKLVNAVADVKHVSHDLSLSHKLQLRDGRELTALEILAIYLERVQSVVTSESDRQVDRLWQQCLELLSSGGPEAAAHLLDWCAKWSLIKRFVNRGLDIAHPKIALIDLQYCDIDPSKSLYHALVLKGAMETIFSEKEVLAAADTPPEDTRAYFRGAVARKFAGDVVSASWESVVLKAEGREHVIRLTHLGSFTRAEVGEIVDKSESAHDLVSALAEAGVYTP